MQRTAASKQATKSPEAQLPAHTGPSFHSARVGHGAEATAVLSQPAGSADGPLGHGGPARWEDGRGSSQDARPWEGKEGASLVHFPRETRG